ncbi:protein FAM83H [Poeciliopsis prolifica]|uniref:protein FAM83H n=1 Tax=Poeciliopsis prolifica TaxID=188132 RepID=UPI002414410C|nr:protein FAM83H [Poeciliopsis prolifica]XP_054877728.1 protein FAM83H [Poeciliopsis prolifica]
MARRSQCSSAGDNPLDPNYLPPHYREEYRLAVDSLVEESLEGYYQCLQKVDVVDFLSPTEIQYIQSIVQPPKQSILSEQQFLDSEGEGSSDTYWPIHSDLDVPGLDLGWPQVHHFIEPTEVTTLVNPPEPDMPSIKEQARRLIKNAQQVIAIVMDMFTDVDIFADILNAAGRRVAVYILLDEQNADLFVNMVSNCRVNLQAFPFIRMRTVSGITYQCRSGKSFKGQMMDRFLLTDCRAVLSGNYSFMWSFEKLHRCMAHLFLGQLVTTFDEEFRILFAQSQPLNVDNVLAQMEDLKDLQKRQFPDESTSLYRKPKRFLDIPSDDWGGHPYDDQLDGNLRIMALKRQGSLRGPADMYNRFGSQQRLDPGFDQGSSRHLMTDNPVLKRHSYSEDVPGRYSFPLMPQPGMPDSEPRGKPFHRGQQPFPGPGPEEDYSSYDKFWNQGYLPEQYSVPALQQEIPPEFDPVLNYLSSTRNLDVDQGTDKLQPPVDFSFTSPQPKRLGVGQPYACQTSPTPSNSADQKPFFHDLALNRKDPTVKQKLRNWRIDSYLSTYDNPEEEGLPMVSTQLTDTFQEPLNPIQQMAQLPDLPASKIPNVKEFKVTTVPRVSQMPGFVKAITQEKSKKVLDDPAPVVIETKTTPASSETYTAEERKTEEDQKQPKRTGLQRDDSFKRKYNPGGLRTSRLRSSLIFSSLEQQTSQETAIADQNDEGGDKMKTEPAKLPLVSQVLGQRRSTAREPFEWSRYIKSSLETLKPDNVSKKEEDKDASRGKNSQDLTDALEAKEAIKTTNVEQDNISLSMPQVKLPELKAPETDRPVQPTEPLLTDVDMNDPDKRLMFFKELAAKRKAAEAQKEKEKAELKPQSELKNMLICQKEESLPKRTHETSVAKDSIEKPSENISSKDSIVPKPSTELQVQPKKTELDSQSIAGLSVSTETDPTLPNPFVKDSLSALIPQSKPTSVELPETDQPVKLPDLLSTSSYIDMSDPDNRLMYFKELAAKRKASQAKKGEEEAPVKPQADLQNTSASQKEEDPPKGTPESMEPSVPKGSSENSTTLSTETSPSLKHDENTRKQDSLVKNDPSTLRTSAEQVQEVSAESVKTDSERHSAEETKASQSKSSENPTASELSVQKNSPKQATVSHTAVSSTGEGADKGEPPTLEYISIVSSLGKDSSSSTPQNTESVQLETSIHSLPLPSEAETTSEIGSVQISTSDSPPLDSGLHHHPATTEETSFSDSALKEYSSTNVSRTTSSNIDGIKAQEPGGSSQQEPSDENLQTSDQTHLNAVSQSASSENTSVSDASNTEPVVSPDKTTADLEPGNLNASTETNRKESFAAAPLVEGLEENVTEFGQEESVTKECKTLKSPEDGEAQSTSPAVCPSTPDSTLPSESGPEGSVSEPDLEKTISSVTHPVDTQPEDVPKETGSLENTESPKASLLEKSELAPEVAIQTPLSSKLKLIDLIAPSAPETLSSSSTSESVQSGLDPEAKVSVTSTEENFSDSNSISNDTQPKSEESLVQPTESTKAAPANLPCKLSEVLTPPSQTPEPAAPQERSNKEAEFGETDEKKSNNLEDKDKSQKLSTEDPASREKTKDQSKQSNCSETTEVTSKQPKSSQSRYHSSTVNVITSSNLRDDTKLLLEQISAQSQSRNEATKESPVTDDEKEDKADKKTKNEKELGYKSYNRGQTKTTQEKEKLLERIQSMRKERKVYSRFEMAP